MTIVICAVHEKVHRTTAKYNYGCKISEVPTIRVQEYDVYDFWKWQIAMKKVASYFLETQLSSNFPDTSSISP